MLHVNNARIDGVGSLQVHPAIVSHKQSDSHIFKARGIPAMNRKWVLSSDASQSENFFV